MTQLAVALAHAAAGRRVLYCNPETKAPWLPDWPNAATTDAATIRQWWAEHPTAIPGWALPADVVCVDGDPRNGASAATQPGVLPPTRIVATGGGGAHFFYRVPADRPLKNGVIAAGWDCKTAGGMVILDGAVRADGGRYTLAADLPLAAAPEWLLVAKARGGAPTAAATPARAADAPLIWSAGAEHEATMTPALVALLATVYAQGGRHAKVRALGAVLARAGWTLDAIATLVRQLPSATPDARVMQALDAARRVHEGEPVPQAKALAAAFGDRLARHVVELARQPVLADIDAANAAAAAQAEPAFELPVTPKRAAPEALRVASVYAKIAPVDWVCEFLRLAAGAPTIVAGYGGAGKTLLVQTLVVCIVTGTPFFGHPVKKGRVRHYDYEQGARITLSRYQRIAAAMGLPDDALADGLDIVCGPDFKLTTPGARERLVKECDGYTLAVFDSLRASTDGDENDASARVPLDMVFGVSEATRCAMLVIHHARKASKTNGAGGNQDMRGSSAVNDACQTVIMLKPNGDAGFSVECGKVREGRAFKPFDVAITDPPVAHDGFNQPGLRLDLVDGGARRESDVKAALEADTAAVLGFLTEQPAGRFKGGYKTLFAAMGERVARNRVEAALGLLVSSGRIGRDRDAYIVTPGTPGVVMGSDGLPRITGPGEK